MVGEAVDLYHLQTFCQAARGTNFTQAAEELSLS